MGRKGQIPWNKGISPTEEQIRKQRETLMKNGHGFQKGYTPYNKGGTSWNKGLKGTHFSPSTEFKKGEVSPKKGKTWEELYGIEKANELKQINSKAKIGVFAGAKNYFFGKHDWAGEKSPHWKGGITPINEKIRKSFDYRKWREAVFKRDNYTCQKCGHHGGYLHADHIKPFALHPELRLDVNNGRVLCVKCHKETDTYGTKSKKKKNNERFEYA